MRDQSETEERRRVAIRNQRGLHARAASKLVKVASGFEAEIWVMRDDMVVGAESIMGLMMLGAGQGQEVELWTRGPEAAEAMAALLDLIERGFDEDV